MKHVLLWGLLCGLLCAAVATTASAGSLTLTWDAVTGSTYRVYQSTDLGQTWVKIAEATTLPIVVSVPDNVLVLLRAANVNAAGETLRTSEGIWYDSRLASPTPTEVGVR